VRQPVQPIFIGAKPLARRSTNRLGFTGGNSKELSGCSRIERLHYEAHKLHTCPKEKKDRAGTTGRQQAAEFWP